MKISNLRKSFERFALDVESLTVPQGVVSGIIGPNGCGKTTLMKIMAGLLPHDSGSIDYGGLTPRDMTMVFRKPYLMHDTVERNLVYPLNIRGIKPDPALIGYYLELTDLQDYRNAYAPALSGGEQQKLALARALIFSPKLIFVDEGFSNMDIESVARFEDYILDAQRTQPITWVVISHQLSNVRRLCEHVFFMHDGRLETHGKCEQVLHQPESAALRRYLQYS